MLFPGCAKSVKVVHDNQRAVPKVFNESTCSTVSLAVPLKGPLSHP